MEDFRPSGFQDPRYRLVWFDRYVVLYNGEPLLRVRLCMEAHVAGP